MPSSTFLNLSKAKQDSILNAAVLEFSSVPFSKASINKIIQTAKISRGSFYMYFTDKYDLMGYLLTLFQQLLKEYGKQVLEEQKGDLFNGMIKIHDYLYSIYQNKDYQAFFKNLMMYFQTSAEEELCRMTNQKSPSEDLEELAQYIDRRTLKFQLDEDLLLMIGICYTLIRKGLYHAVLNNMSIEESRNKLKKSYQMLASGIYQQEWRESSC